MCLVLELQRSSTVSTMIRAIAELELRAWNLLVTFLLSLPGTDLVAFNAFTARETEQNVCMFMVGHYLLDFCPSHCC